MNTVAIVMAVLQATSQLAPELAQIVPLIEKLLNGTALTEADLTALDTAAAALNVQLSA